jgi:vitamin K-dependent gamma-carboxylase-like protein
MTDTSSWTWWQSFWHEPVRAERLAITRIFLGLALLTDQLFQYLPHFAVFYGPEGVAPAHVHDEWLLSQWRWTILFFNTDDLVIVGILFWLRVALTVAFLVGWHTRITTVVLYFLTMAFVHRNPALRNGAEDTLMVGLFLMMFCPSGRAFSLDRLRWLRQHGPEAGLEPPTTAAWPVRLIQIQVCMIYMSTGLAKLLRNFDGDFASVLDGTWWQGTSLHYVLNDTTMGRWSYAQLPLPLWMTAPLTYLSVWWEALFPFLVMCRWTRRWTMWFGVLFHLGIYFTIEVGWFSFYTLSLYGVWIPGEFWDRWLFRKQPRYAAINAHN